jgi:hypothetical protein
MRIIFAIVALILLGFVALAQVPSWVNKNYHVLTDGNTLYSYCQSTKKNVTISGTNLQIPNSAGTDLFPAGMCWGYIEAIVDSIPTGEGFEPDPEVKGSQYVDVVFAYLRDHPEQRHLPAYFLTRYALTDAFPAKPKR